MNFLNDIPIILLTIIFALAGLFFGFIIQHERERKKEIHKARSGKSSTGQHNQSGNDVASATPTASATSTQTT